MRFADPAEVFRIIQSEDDVFCNAQVGNQHEMLMNHADPVIESIAGRQNGSRLPVYQYLSGVRLTKPIYCIHQGGFSGAILTKESMDLSPFNLKIDVIICNQAAKTFRNAN